MKVKTAPKLRCLRCQHRWRPRGDEVTICPKCKSPYWNKPKNDNHPKATSRQKATERPLGGH